MVFKDKLANLSDFSASFCLKDDQGKEGNHEEEDREHCSFEERGKKDGHGLTRRTIVHDAVSVAKLTCDPVDRGHGKPSAPEVGNEKKKSFSYANKRDG